MEAMKVFIPPLAVPLSPVTKEGDSKDRVSSKTPEHPPSGGQEQKEGRVGQVGGQAICFTLEGV